MAFNLSRRTAPSAPRAHSIFSDASFAVTPHATPPPPTRRSDTRAVRANSIVSDAATHLERPNTKRVAPHYSLPPTVPNPFAGTLEASLDAVLAWGSENATQNSKLQAVVDSLLREVHTATNWPELLREVMTGGSGADDDGTAGQARGRYLVEELLFLVTRTLLPEQITENRAAMGRLYDRKKQLAVRLLLRYDMLREWRMGASNHSLTVASVPPANFQPPLLMPSATPQMYPHRRLLMPNVLATLIAAPPGGFTTHAVKERMKHHVTDLDDYLLLPDERVARWSDSMLLGMTSQIILQWQWVRQNNEFLQEMEVYEWEELEGRAEECEWIADDMRKPSSSRRERGGAGADVKEAEKVIGH